MFLGEDLLAWMVLAFGGAMFVGNLAALFKPRDAPREAGELTPWSRTTFRSPSSAGSTIRR